MIDTLKPYPAYKASGVEWLGQVPGHWDMRRGKTLFKRVQRPVRSKDEVVTCFRDGVVTLRRNRRTEGFTESLKEIGYQGIRKGDLVIHAMDAFAGAVGVADCDGKGSPVYAVCIPSKEANQHYYAFIIREMARSKWILALATGIRERSTDFRFATFGTQFLPLPPLPEQQAIVRFLDYVDQRVRRVIRARRRLVKLLEEYKQALIHQAVTGRIDVRTGQPYPEYKDSGVEWLGEVPEHWEVRKVKHTVTFTGGGTPSKAVTSYWAGNIPWASPKDMSRGVLYDTADHISGEALLESATSLVPEGALLIVVRSGILRRKIPAAVNAVPMAINQDMKALRPRAELATAAYLRAFIQGNQGTLLTEWTKHGTTVESIEHELLANSQIPLPPLPEQQAIVAFLDEQTGKLDHAADAARREIELLEEFRTRLIADVVTGKLDVREAAARLPDPDPLAADDDFDEADAEQTGDEAQDDADDMAAELLDEDQ